ncbi:MAG: ribose 5-phosphate isomerase B [Prevotellaceae bacterium]|jgi:ribose 5-phosphate isomerase B|nr:ribose 5-phosphate isomerase B [Prevotellaceae bacterium]
MIRIGIASDHAGFTNKEEIKKRLISQGYTITDFGSHSCESIDYPDVAHPLAIAVELGKVSMGIALCGTGNGINMTLNKHQGVRSALCWAPEIATLARKHNDANICALPARFIDLEVVFEVIDAFLHASFEGGRHQKRVEKIPC